MYGGEAGLTELMAVGGEPFPVCGDDAKRRKFRPIKRQLLPRVRG